MSKRILSIVALTAFIASQCTAAGLFNLRRKTKRSPSPNKIPLSVLRSPEKMTERFGPSVLVREPGEATEVIEFTEATDATKESRKSREFVTQPD